MIAFTAGEFARLTLLGAGLGVIPLAVIICLHHLFDWVNGDPEAWVFFLARLGTLFIVFPITWVLFEVTEVNPFDWKTIMYGVGVVMVCIAYFILARRWGRPRPRHRKEK